MAVKQTNENRYRLSALIVFGPVRSSFFDVIFLNEPPNHIQIAVILLAVRSGHAIKNTFVFSAPSADPGGDPPAAGEITRDTMLCVRGGGRAG